jgi:hypothetical protein
MLEMVSGLSLVLLSIFISGAREPAAPTGSL